ncbi:GNAT family N-acetyltransferase [Streptomyces sp. ODS28]|uniref:GNAT family N-acetyltransferase n=1 Tax=Streptomyces sp. ODS28 TaxID=3136688 RepID=UPI0031EC7AA3
MQPDPAAPAGPAPPPEPEAGERRGPEVTAGTDADDTMDLYDPAELHAALAADGYAGGAGGHAGEYAEEYGELDAGGDDGTARTDPQAGDDLLDHVGSWPATHTPVGRLRLVPVRLPRDLGLIASWMNDPAVAAFWELDGPEERTAEHVRAQLDGDGRSVPCLGLLDGRPVGYWEIYRADLDPLSRYCPMRPHDTGLHVLLGRVSDRGRGVGTALLRAVADLVLDQRPGCARVLAEPDLRNIPSVAAFLGAGFRFGAEVDLPDKRAALMVRDRRLRSLL